MKAKAVIEVVVVFVLIWLILALVGLSPLGDWERQITGRFNFIEYTLIIAITLLVLVISRKNLASYGISFRNLRHHLDIAVTAFLPVALGYLPIAFIGNNHKQWWGSLIMTGVNIAVLFFWAGCSGASRHEMRVASLWVLSCLSPFQILLSEPP